MRGFSAYRRDSYKGYCQTEEEIVFCGLRTSPVAGNAINAVCFVVTAVKLTFCACAMLCSRPVMAVRFHRERTAAFVPKPSRNDRNVHTRFDAARREQMPQLVMCETICPDRIARSIKRLLTFTNAENLCFE